MAWIWSDHLMGGLAWDMFRQRTSISDNTREQCSVSHSQNLKTLTLFYILICLPSYLPGLGPGTRDPQPLTLRLYAFLPGTLHLWHSSCMHFYPGPCTSDTQIVCIFTRDPEPLTLRLYAFLPGTRNLWHSDCMHFSQDPAPLTLRLYKPPP